MRDTKLVTNVREIEDPEELQRRRALVESRSPTQLGQIHGLTDMPVPTRIENLFKNNRSRSSSRVRENEPPKTFGKTRKYSIIHI